MTPYKINTNKTWDDTIRDLEDTFRKWKVHNWSVHPMRQGHRPSFAKKDDLRVTVTFTTPAGEDVDLSLDTQPSRREHLRALALAIEDMRMIEVRGLNQVFRQRYARLPAPEPTVGKLIPQDPYTLLGVRQDAAMDVIEAAYRAKVRKEHPDAGGNREMFLALTQAIETIRKERP